MYTQEDLDQARDGLRLLKMKMANKGMAVTGMGGAKRIGSSSS
jgi:hypothetical protein